MGVRPWLVVASAGTVDTGAVDPLAEIADICAAIMAPGFTSTAPMAACSCCATKGGRCSAGSSGPTASRSIRTRPCSCPTAPARSLVRDGRHLLDAFSASADYIRPLGESEVGPSPADLSPELTRHFRALRLWLPLQIAGVAAFRAAQSEKIALARYFHARLSEMDGLGCRPAARPLGRRLPLPARPGRRGRVQRPPAAALQEEGRVFLSGTRIDGAAWLRCAILSFRTHLAHIDETIDVLVRTAAALQSE